MEWKEVRRQLAAPFPDDEIDFLPRATNSGRAMAIAHIDARAVMNRLDEVVGPDGWSFIFDMLSPDGKKVKGRLTVLGITKEDAGEAASEEEPLKAAVSDAVKRCGVQFGIARYLKLLPQLWVNFDQQKRRFAEQPRLDPQAVRRALAQCGYPAGSAVPRPEPNPAQARVEQARENLADRAPEVAAHAEAQAVPSQPNGSTTPYRALALQLRDAWSKDGGNPDDRTAMWSCFNRILGHEGSNVRLTEDEINRLLEKRAEWGLPNSPAAEASA